jgi:hypothetical protein
MSLCLFAGDTQHVNLPRTSVRAPKQRMQRRTFSAADTIGSIFARHCALCITIRTFSAGTSGNPFYPAFQPCRIAACGASAGFDFDFPPQGQAKTMNL